MRTLILCLVAFFSSFAYANLPERREGNEIWRLDSLGGSSVSPPAIGTDGTLYVTSDWGLYAVTPAGSVKWHTELSSLTSPVIGARAIYVTGAGDQGRLTLFSINSANGVVTWRFSTTWPAWMGGVSPAKLKYGGITALVAGPYLYAVGSDGTEVWRFEFDDNATPAGPPAIGMNDVVYVPERYVYAVRPNGSEYWRFSPSADWDGRFTSVIVGANETIFATADDGALYAIGADGRLKWRFTTNATDQSITGTPALGPDGTLYVTYDSGSLLGESGVLAIHSDGTKKWQLGLSECNGYPPNLMDSAPAVGYDNVIYVNSDDGCLYAIDSKGKQRWMRVLEYGSDWVGPTILWNKVLYAGLGDGSLSAIGISSMGWAISPWPMWRANVEQTNRINFKGRRHDEYWPCAATASLSGDKTIPPPDRESILEAMRTYRDSVLKASIGGQRWLGIYQQHRHEINRIVQAFPSLAARSAKTLVTTWPAIAAANKNGGRLVLHGQDVEEIRSILAEYRRHASPALAASFNELYIYLGIHSHKGNHGHILIPSP